MTLPSIAFSAPLLAIPAAGLLLVVRHGPIRNPWWHGENTWGFAAMIGGLAFAAGFFGPLIVTPEANQGPLLGIFITGPAGLALGVIWGLLRAARRKRKAEQEHDAG